MEESRERAKDEEKYTCEKLTKVDITIMEKVKNQRKVSKYMTLLKRKNNNNKNETEKKEIILT